MKIENVNEIAKMIRDYTDEHHDEVMEIIQSMIDTDNDYTLDAVYNTSTKEVDMYKMVSGEYYMLDEEKIAVSIFSTKALDIKEMMDDKYCNEAIIDELMILYKCGLDGLEKKLKLNYCE